MVTQINRALRSMTEHVSPESREREKGTSPKEKQENRDLEQKLDQHTISLDRYVEGLPNQNEEPCSRRTFLNVSLRRWTEGALMVGGFGAMLRSSLSSSEPNYAPSNFLKPPAQIPLHTSLSTLVPYSLTYDSRQESQLRELLEIQKDSESAPELAKALHSASLNIKTFRDQNVAKLRSHFKRYSSEGRVNDFDAIVSKSYQDYKLGLLGALETYRKLSDIIARFEEFGSQEESAAEKIKGARKPSFKEEDTISALPFAVIQSLSNAPESLEDYSSMLLVSGMRGGIEEHIEGAFENNFYGVTANPMARSLTALSNGAARMGARLLPYRESVTPLSENPFQARSSVARFVQSQALVYAVELLSLSLIEDKNTQELALEVFFEALNERCSEVRSDVKLLSLLPEQDGFGDEFFSPSLTPNLSNLRIRGALLFQGALSRTLQVVDGYEGVDGAACFNELLNFADSSEQNKLVSEVAEQLVTTQKMVVTHRKTRPVLNEVYGLRAEAREVLMAYHYDEGVLEAL